METNKVTFDTQITVKQAYLAMFEYLDRFWNQRNKPEDVGVLLGLLSLWNSDEGKRPMDNKVFSEWLDCTKKILDTEGSEKGYRNADIDLT